MNTKKSSRNKIVKTTTYCEKVRFQNGILNLENESGTVQKDFTHNASHLNLFQRFYGI